MCVTCVTLQILFFCWAYSCGNTAVQIAGHKTQNRTPSILPLLKLISVVGLMSRPTHWQWSTLHWSGFVVAPRPARTILCQWGAMNVSSRFQYRGSLLCNRVLECVCSVFMWESDWRFFMNKPTVCVYTSTRTERMRSRHIQAHSSHDLILNGLCVCLCNKQP